jgi:hypothetical protein
MRVPGRVRKHLEAVELGSRGIGFDLEDARLSPALLPFPIEFLWTIIGHRWLTKRGSPPIAQESRDADHHGLKEIAGRSSGTAHDNARLGHPPEARSPFP